MLIVVSAIAFALLSSVGGDALSALRENPQVSEETIERLRVVYGLDEPVVTRYLRWVRGIFHRDFGESFVYRTEVSGIIFSRLISTSILAIVALAIAVIISGVLAFAYARTKSKFLEGIIDIVVILTASAPRLVLSLLALAISVSLAGSAAAIRDGSMLALLLAGFVLSVPLIAVFLSQLHTALKHAMKEPFVQYARAKGLGENTIILKHATRAAIDPFLAMLGLSFGALIGGSVIVESVLGWPGLGALTVSAVRTRDVPLVMGIVVVSSAAVWLGNSLAEFLQLINDSRMRKSGGSGY